MTARTPRSIQAARRLPARERRQQLLEVAAAVVRSEGTDALTLGHLALRAGISKPVVYDHFGDRPGLLVALYQQLDDQRMDLFRAGIAGRAVTLSDASDELAAAYVDCATATGGEFFAVGAALAGTEEHGKVTTRLLDGYAALFADILGEHAEIGDEVRREIRMRSIGLVGAAEALSGAVLREALPRDAAVSTLSALLRGAVS